MIKKRINNINSGSGSGSYDHIYTNDNYDDNFDEDNDGDINEDSYGHEKYTKANVSTSNHSNKTAASSLVSALPSALPSSTKNNYSYNPVKQTNFDLNTLLPASKSSTQIASSYMDQMEVIQSIGTTHSRKGKYIRQTWKQTWRKKKKLRIILYCFVFFLLLLVIHKSTSSSSSKSNSSSSSSSTNSKKKHNNDFMTNEDDDYNDDKYSNNGNDDDNNFYSSTYFKNKIHMNDYTNLKSDSLHSKYTQNKLVRNIPKSCLRQYFQSQSQKDSMCQPKCPIENPFQSQKGHGSWWKKALNMNEELINDYLDSIKTNANAGGNNDPQTGDNTDNKIPNKNKNKDMLDIVFYGDSITEHWNGRSMGDFGKSLEETNTVFQKYFNPFTPTSANTSSRNDDVNGSDDNDDDDDGIEKLKALALGIAGDKTTNLLYRIQKNDGNENANMNDDYDDGENKSGVELPDELQSKVFWLLIGTNDLSYNCAEDVVLLGILSIVEELRLKRPNSIVVVNGLLPRTNDVNGRLIHRYSNDGDEKNLDENENEHYSDDSEDSADSADSAKSEHNDDDDDDNLNNDESSTSTAVTAHTNSSSNETENDEKTRRRTNKIENKKVFDYWPSIQAINHQLKQYAKKNDKVEFFDPSHLFVAQMGNEFYKRNESFLMKELQYDYLHPSAFGHEVWAKAIIDYYLSDLDTPENLNI